MEYFGVNFQTDPLPRPRANNRIIGGEGSQAGGSTTASIGHLIQFGECSSSTRAIRQPGAGLAGLRLASIRPKTGNRPSTTIAGIDTVAVNSEAERSGTRYRRGATSHLAAGRAGWLGLIKKTAAARRYCGISRPFGGPPSLVPKHARRLALTGMATNVSPCPFRT